MQFKEQKAIKRFFKHQAECYTNKPENTLNTKLLLKSLFNFKILK